MEEATKEDITFQTDKIMLFGQQNIDQINLVLGAVNGEEINFYYGLIRRHIVLNCDIKNIFESNLHGSFISQYILCRCIMDDYIRISFLFSQQDSSEALICLNADARKMNFLNLSKIAEINEKYIHKEMPYYPTVKFVDDAKIAFLKEDWTDKYFTDKASFRFKRFPTTREIVDNYPDADKASMSRSFFLWRHFSDYVHFSSFSADLEMSESERGFNFIQEAVFHSYKTMLKAVIFFKERYGSDIIDSENLANFYQFGDDL